MKDLERTDIKTYLALQKHPQFRPLGQTLVGLKAGEKSLVLGAGIATGGFTGSVEKWLETTVKDMMKRDRWGPYAKVLGSRASTLPAPPAPAYSNSRLGQYLKADDARAATASKDAAAAQEKARAGVRAARGVAVTRVFGPMVDLGIGALNPEVHGGATNFVIETKLKRALADGSLTVEEYETAHNLMAQGNFGELHRFLQQKAVP